MTPAYDVIVIGLGGMGSAAVAHLAKRGKRVLGLEQHERLHTHGSSHGVHRIIREAYFEAPQYVPLVQRAYALWRELEKENGRHLLTITGGLNIGTPESAFVSGSLASARQHDLPHEYLDHEQVAERFPGFRLTDDLVAVYEPNAGYLKPEACLPAHFEIARKYGAELHFEEGVREWDAGERGARVRTDKAEYTAERLVITAGPWAPQLLADLNLPLSVRRIVNVHFRPRDREPYLLGRCPVYLLQVPEGDYYGFPVFPGRGLKIGRHDIGEITTPQTIRRDVGEDEVEMLRAVLDRYLPWASGEVMETLTCMYTDTPDLHFIIDHAPGYDNVVIACGFSGHGFKFVSVVGELLADLALEGGTHFDIGFLSASRFAAECI
jgi:sarcosine oxidase